MNKTVILAFWVVLAACAPMASDTTAATDHLVYTSDVLDQAAGAVAQVGPFAVPAGSRITYAVVDRTTALTLDAMGANVFSSPVGVPYAPGAGSTFTETTPAVPAGSYVVQVQCQNLLEDCLFSLDVSAFY